MIEILLPYRTQSSFVNSVGTNKKPRAARFSGFTQNRLEMNRQKCLQGMYPRNLWWAK